jgi:hypothetical protein
VEYTDAVRETLAAYRAEIIDRFRPKQPMLPVARRVVLLTADRDSEIEQVLEEPPTAD